MSIRMGSFDPRTVAPNVFPIGMNSEEIKYILERLGCIWLYDGEIRREIPHAVLAHGDCSNGYVDCSRALCYPNICQVLGQQLSDKLVAAGVKRVDCVIGVPNGANTLAYEVARTYGVHHFFAVKIEDSISPSKKIIWRRGVALPAGATVLLIEDALTTGDSIRELREAIKNGNENPVNILDTVGAIVHRPSHLPITYGDMRVVSLLEKEIQVFESDECPYCNVGSLKVHPKTHWLELTGKV
jgi:orotate phosphoribosyltransferase